MVLGVLIAGILGHVISNNIIGGGKAGTKIRVCSIDASPHNKRLKLSHKGELVFDYNEKDTQKDFNNVLSKYIYNTKRFYSISQKDGKLIPNDYDIDYCIQINDKNLFFGFRQYKHVIKFMYVEYDSSNIETIAINAIQQFIKDISSINHYFTKNMSFIVVNNKLMGSEDIEYIFKNIAIDDIAKFINIPMLNTKFNQIIRLRKDRGLLFKHVTEQGGYEAEIINPEENKVLTFAPELTQDPPVVPPSEPIIIHPTSTPIPEQVIVPEPVMEPEPIPIESIEIKPEELVTIPSPEAPSLVEPITSIESEFVISDPIITEAVLEVPKLPENYLVIQEVKPDGYTTMVTKTMNTYINYDDPANYTNMKIIEDTNSQVQKYINKYESTNIITKDICGLLDSYAKELKDYLGKINGKHFCIYLNSEIYNKVYFGFSNIKDSNGTSNNVMYILLPCNKTLTEVEPDITKRYQLNTRVTYYDRILLLLILKLVSKESNIISNFSDSTSTISGEISSCFNYGFIIKSSLNKFGYQIMEQTWSTMNLPTMIQNVNFQTMIEKM
jgi:hypothetical protein